MIYFVKVGWSNIAVDVGDKVEVGDLLGRNPRTLQPVYSPITGVVTDSIYNTNRYNLILVIEPEKTWPREPVTALFKNEAMLAA